MRYTYVRQHDSTDCAAAALAMVCLHYKKEITITRLRDMMGTDLKGTNLVGLQKAATELGFESAAVRVDRENFLSDFTLPCIAQVITPQGMTHFVVIFKKTTIKDDEKRHLHMVEQQKAKADPKKKSLFHRSKEDYLVIGDPASELKKITVDEFYKGFTGVLLLLTPDNSFTPGKVKQGNLYKRYFDLMWPQKKLFFFTLLSSVLLTVLGIVSSMFNKVLMDEILPYGMKNIFLTYLLVFTGVSVVSQAISFIRSWIMYFLSIKIDIPLMLGYFGHIYKLPMKFFATRKTGDITTRFSDAGKIKSILTSIALSLVMDIVMLFGTGYVLYRMNASLFSIMLLSAVVSFFLVLVFRQPFKRINEESMQQSAIMNSELIEGLRAVETIKANAVEEVEMENIEREYIKSLRIGYRSNLLSSSQSIVSSLVSLVINTLSTYVGINQVLSGTITLGSYMAFTTLAGYFSSPISDLIGLQFTIQECTISMKRLTEIMDHELEQPADREYSKLESIDGDVEFKDVTFRYGTRNPVLKHVSFTIPKGKKVALVGSSGSGKSTTAKLLLKYYEPEDGCITINGVDMREYSNQSIREAIAYVPQNVELFSKSILENIRIVRRNATQEQVREAAIKADAHEFIRKLPLQYNTYLEEAGNGLSGGEKQRIALARAFLKEASFYIFDESTSSLDFATENTIFDMVYNKLSDCSMLIIAHRLSTIRNCDKILVMNEGEIVESGTHDELLALQGRYWTLWNMQQGIMSPKHDTPTAPAPATPAFAVEEDDDEDTVTY